MKDGLPQPEQLCYPLLVLPDLRVNHSDLWGHEGGKGRPYRPQPCLDLCEFLVQPPHAVIDFLLLSP